MFTQMSRDEFTNLSNVALAADLQLPNTQTVMDGYECKVVWDFERKKFTFQLV